MSPNVSSNYQRLMLIQILGSATILGFVPNNILKTLAFILLWSLTFKKWSRGEVIFFLGAALFFTSMDYATLQQGIFQFSAPDFLLMPYYEPLLWGYLLLHTSHTLQTPAPNTSWWLGLVLLVILCLPYLFLTNQVTLTLVTSAIVFGALIAFREKEDRQFAGYMVVLGFLWEYTGVWTGQWSYPNPPIGGVPPWFIPTFAGVGIIFRRMVLPLLSKSTRTESVNSNMQRSFAYTGLIFASCLFISPCSAHAGGLRLLDQDAEATARGNAFTATAENASAAYYNPAALTHLKGFQTRSGFYGVLAHADYDSESHHSATKDRFQGPPQGYLSFHEDESKFAYGLALYSPFGSGIKWPDSSGFRGIIRHAELIYATASPVVAYQLTPTLSLGGGPTFNYMDLAINHGLSPYPGDSVYQLNGNGFVTGYTLGAFWVPAEQHSFGFRFVSNTYAHFDGESTATGLPDANNVKATIPFPEFLTFGYSYRPNPDWNLEFDVDWTGWNRDKTIIFRNSSLGDDPLVLQWDSSVNLLFGLTKQIGDGYSISAGYYFNQNSVPTKAFSPSVPDSNKHFVSLGVSKKYDSWGWTVAYQHGFSEKRSVDGSPRSPVLESPDGNYSVHTDALTISLTL